MSADNELTWREAEDLMIAGEVVECLEFPSDSKWARQRIRDGEMQVASAGREDWVLDDSNYASLRASKWRRVPKTPNLHELAAWWRERYAPNNAYTHITKECADELDAALREGEWAPREHAIAAMKYVAELHIGSAIERHEALVRFIEQLRKRAVQP